MPKPPACRGALACRGAVSHDGRSGRPELFIDNPVSVSFETESVERGGVRRGQYMGKSKRWLIRQWRGGSGSAQSAIVHDDKGPISSLPTMQNQQRDAMIVKLARRGVPSHEVARRVGARFPPVLGLWRVRAIAAAHGANFVSPQQQNLVDDALLDQIVFWNFAKAGVNYGWRMILPDIEAMLPPGQRVSRRQLLRSMLRCNPAAAAARRAQAWRKLTRRVVYAPWTGYRWEVDYNLKLAFVGLAAGGVWDSCPRLWVRLRMVDNKLAFVQWAEVVEPVVIQHGFSDQLTTDKGDENYLTAFAWRAAAVDAGRQNADGTWNGRPPHRFLPSKRQPGVERSWGEYNGRVAIPVFDLVTYMESILLLDLTNPYHLGAMQQLLLPLTQHACDILRSRWNRHFVRGTFRRPGGVPEQVAVQHPHPGNRTQLQPGADMVARYEAARGKPMRREPVWRAQRDPLHGNGAAQRRRAQAVAAVWGDVAATWTDILTFRGANRFIPSFRVFLAAR